MRKLLKLFPREGCIKYWELLPSNPMATLPQQYMRFREFDCDGALLSVCFSNLFPVLFGEGVKQSVYCACWTCQPMDEMLLDACSHFAQYGIWF